MSKQFFKLKVISVSFMLGVLILAGCSLFFPKNKKLDSCYFSRMNQGMLVDFNKNKNGNDVYDICNNELCIQMEVYPNGQPKKIIFEKEINPKCDDINTVIPTGTVYFDSNGTYNYSNTYPLEYYENGNLKKRLVNSKGSKYYKYISFSLEGDTLGVEYINKENYMPKK